MSDALHDMPPIPANKEPVIVWKLADGIIGFDLGFEYRIEDIDGDEFYARDKDHMDCLIQWLSLFGVTRVHMEALRQARLERQRGND